MHSLHHSPHLVIRLASDQVKAPPNDLYANNFDHTPSNGISNGASNCPPLLPPYHTLDHDIFNSVRDNTPNGNFCLARPEGERKQQKRHRRQNYSDASPTASRSCSLYFRPKKRSMQSPDPDHTIAVINAAGRQAASFIRVVTAVGYHVRAQLRNLRGVIATEVSTNRHVTVLEGELYTCDDKAATAQEDVTADVSPGIGVNHRLITDLFRGARLAFINTTFYGDEIKIGKALADAAKEAGIRHYVYSSMPDHQAYSPEWPSLPLWASKHKIEEYVNEIGLPATFLYTGIYNNNFTSLPYPLFETELQPDGSFAWQAPFHPDAKLPWLDAEHDVGPAVLQIFKDGVEKWRGKRAALAFEMLSPREACEAFARGVGRSMRYIRGPIQIKVKIPEGYRIQLEALEKLYSLNNDDPAKQPPYFGDAQLDASCPGAALELWEGPRGLEEYAREVFPLEEQANGMKWMLEDTDYDASDDVRPTPTESDAEEEDEGLVMKGKKREEEDWLP